MTKPIVDEKYFTVEVEDSAGCKANATSHITTIAGLFMPNVFTPDDGNGINDTYRIPKGASLALMEFSILIDGDNRN